MLKHKLDFGHLMGLRRACTHYVDMYFFNMISNYSYEYDLY